MADLFNFALFSVDVRIDCSAYGACLVTTEWLCTQCPTLWFTAGQARISAFFLVTEILSTTTEVMS